MSEWFLWVVAALILLSGFSGETAKELLTGQVIPKGREPVDTVPLFNLWTVGWNSDRLAHGLFGYWHAPIFSPRLGTFAFSEPQPTTWAVAPLVWITGSIAIAYNVYLLATLALNSLLTRLLLSRSGLPTIAAMFGGAMGLLLPFISWQLGVLQLTCLWGSLLMILGVMNLCERPTLRNGLLIGLSFGLTYASCNYYGLMFALLSPSLLILVGHQWKYGKLWGSLAIGVITAAVCVSPIVWAQLKYLAPDASPRHIDRVETLSAYSDDYAWHRSPSLPWLNYHFGHPGRPLGVGGITLLLAVCGLCRGILVRTNWTVFLLAFSTAALTLSCGTHFEVWGWSPFVSLREWCPGVGYLRTPFRFAIFVQWGVTCLAAEGVATLWEWTARFQTWGLRISRSMVVLLPVLAIVETWPLPSRMTSPPDPTRNENWMTWIREETEPYESLIHFPFAKDSSVASYEFTAEQMTLAFNYDRPLVNGYSGFFPDSHFLTKQAAVDFPGDFSEEAILWTGASYAVVHLKECEEWQREAFLKRTPLFHDQKAQVVIFPLPLPAALP
ncbi:MAG: hypothetical protein KDA80_00065 [Planctomycetaceae bacterium]|nr:hypothetical protein [Planctomycetaceae bacterium]